MERHVIQTLRLAQKCLENHDKTRLLPTIVFSPNNISLPVIQMRRHRRVPRVPPSRTGPSTEMGRTAQLENQTPHLTNTSLPQRPWYHRQLSAWYLLLLKRLTDPDCMCISLSLSVFLTHLLAACSNCFFSCQISPYLQARTRTHTHAFTLTHTHIITKFDKKKRAAETRGAVLLSSSELSVLVKEQ